MNVENINNKISDLTTLYKNDENILLKLEHYICYYTRLYVISSRILGMI